MRVRESGPGEERREICVGAQGSQSQGVVNRKWKFYKGRGRLQWVRLLGW